MSWRDSVNQSAGPASIVSIGAYVSPMVGAMQSPLDVFYSSSRDVLLAGTPTFLAAHPTMGPLLLVGLVSITENYFRDLFSRIIGICPMARSASADQSIRLGSVVWHRGQDVERGAFEHLSFAGAESLIKTAKSFLDYKITRTSLVDEFDRVCELRHAIVHSGAVLAGKNAIKLQVPAASGRLRVVIAFSELQECAAICTSLVVSINREIFIEMCRRWAKEWPKSASWVAAQRHREFMKIWRIFYSQIDAADATIPNPLSPIKCRNQVTVSSF